MCTKKDGQTLVPAIETNARVANSMRCTVALFLFWFRPRALALFSLAWRTAAALFVVIQRCSALLFEKGVLAVTNSQCGMSDIHDVLKSVRIGDPLCLHIPSQTRVENHA